MNPIILTVTVLLPVLGGALIPLLPFRSRRQMLIYIETVVLINTALVLTALLNRPADGFVLFHLNGKLSISFQLDGLGTVFAAIVSLLWPLATLYAFEYMTHEGHEKYFFMFYTITYGITLGIAFAEDIAAHPEPGFEEVRTAGKTAEFLKSLGYEVKEHLAITGVKGEMKRKGGPTLTVIGELDAIGCHSHPMADRRTGVAHACGHHAQMAAMIGCAIAMADPEIQDELDGNVNFLAVPAEEYIDADKRKVLKQQGIEFAGSGKSVPT